jgi:hypothetical protein
VFSAVAVAAAVVVIGASGAGCSSCRKTSGPGATREDVALVPREANLVAMANLKKLRATPLWKRIIEVPEQTPEQKARYADFVKQTGLDPLKQIDSIFVALPQASAAGDYAAILRGGPFDEARLIEFMRKQFKDDGSDIFESEYHGHKRYTDGKGGTTFATFIGKDTIVFANDAWSQKVIDLAATPPVGESARANAALAALIKKTRTDDGVWGAGIVSDDSRQRLAQNDQLKSAGSMKDLYGSVDFTGGLKIDTVVDLGTDADAAELAKTLKDQIAQSRQNSQVQLMGFGRYIDAIKVEAKGPSLHLDVKLDQAGLDDLIERATGLMKTIGGSIGGTPPGQ